MRYSPAHAVAVVPDGQLRIGLGATHTRVNSLHRQGIARLGEGLVVEARADDGIIEAVSVRAARSFALGVQWHPEYRAIRNADSVKIFTAFGDAVRRHAQERNGPRD